MAETQSGCLARLEADVESPFASGSDCIRGNRPVFLDSQSLSRCLGRSASPLSRGVPGAGGVWQGYAQRIIAGEILAPADSEYYVADYTNRSGLGEIYAIPLYTNISGDYYADLSCVAEPNAEIRYDEDSAKYNMYIYYPVEQVPMQDLKIYNFNAYGNFLEKEFEKFPYSPQMGGEPKFPYKIRLLEERSDEE